MHANRHSTASQNLSYKRSKTYFGEANTKEAENPLELKPTKTHFSHL